MVIKPQLLVIYLLKSAIIFLSLSLEAHLAISVVIFLKKKFKSLVFSTPFILEIIINFYFLHGLPPTHIRYIFLLSHHLNLLPA